MPESVADEIIIGYVEEVTWGTDPGTTRTLVRVTSENLRQVTDTVQSNEITGSRMVQDIVRTNVGVEGTIEWELSANTFDTLFQFVLMNSALGNNGSTLRSMTLEREYTDQTNLSDIFTGCVIDRMTLNVAPREIITGSFGIIGKIQSAGTGMTTPTAAATDAVVNAVDHVSALTEGGGSVDLLNWTMELNNNLRTRPLIGVLGPNSVALGRLEINGTIQLYFENNTAYAKYLNFTQSSLQIDITDGSSNGYRIAIPAIKYTEGEKPVPGPNNDIIVTLNWQAKSDGTKMISITALP